MAPENDSSSEEPDDRNSEQTTSSDLPYEEYTAIEDRLREVIEREAKVERKKSWMHVAAVLGGLTFIGSGIYVAILIDIKNSAATAAKTAVAQLVTAEIKEQAEIDAKDIKKINLRIVND